MKLEQLDYRLLISNEVSKITCFAKETSLPYDYLVKTCDRIKEIVKEMKMEYPNVKSGYSNE